MRCGRIMRRAIRPHVVHVWQSCGSVRAQCAASGCLRPPAATLPRAGLFIEADADGSGYLDRFELSNVLRASNLNLTDRQVRQVLAEADENDDNVIQYREFLPLMVDMLQSIKVGVRMSKEGQQRQNRHDAPHLKPSPGRAALVASAAAQPDCPALPRSLPSSLHRPRSRPRP